jgi:hypothetical protein
MLCTGAGSVPLCILQLAVDFWMGGGEGGGGLSWRGRIRRVEGENKRGGAG